MDDLFVKYAYHIDNLRADAGIKVASFCDSVCEPRTYRMYLSGQRVMSQKMLNGFCKKLGFTPKDFYSSYNLYDQEEYQKVALIYQHISNCDFTEARKLLLMFEEKRFINQLAQNLYDYCVIEYNLQTNSITKAHALSLYQKLVDYPQCLNKKSFTIQDILSIRSIAMLEYQAKEYVALDFLRNFLSNPNYILVSSDTRDILPYIYSLVSRHYGMKGDLEDTLLIAEKGIAYCLKSGSFHELGSLYYYAFLSSHRLGDFMKRDEYVKRFIAILYAYHDDDHIKEKLQMISKDISPEYTNMILDSFVAFKVNKKSL